MVFALMLRLEAVIPAEVDEPTHRVEFFNLEENREQLALVWISLRKRLNFIKYHSNKRLLGIMTKMFTKGILAMGIWCDEL
ncbi:hypothetical protein D8674_025571 [Pyrus ussuriensis x Pyrus communis]|uniref:Uncharacterized protein n=1 Tax=Pyrus ussuriensis x Pyrus communis TaxID=2448454 RepID=A0A5N5I749_9ROSA|nr:hypothetical protein D8674_025571 [Pyrus ussuriensis x Pyrus communis]